ncbi:glycoside hydrolase family 5 protein [Mucilaginibacter daejeonensis]|uniref:glycoside hydrolase family 5 protein n=1 Tax=Mucilaginibacter daejeonensis TaxID=398049 RepID=UPI001D174E0B|nr:glycoside hydrolase family 5 protein [Mucilaginibacter daejeonensis]UEG54837.1 glycoside hydrolase family 5 protein [Mucilaginibacter daejeonensis]
MRRYIYTALLACIGLTSVNAQSLTKLKAGPAPFGLNLAGADFGQIPGTYEKDYDYPTASDIDYLKSKGFRLIRLPFLWERLQPRLGGPLDTFQVNKLVAVVDAAEKRNMLVVPDMHNYCRRMINGELTLINTKGVTIGMVADAWKKLAMILKDKKNIWGYGMMNEPHDMPDTTAWFNIAQAIIDQIRTVDKKNAIVVGGDDWSSAAKWMGSSDHLKNLKDPANNLIFEAHLYFDNDGSGTYKYTYENEKGTPETGVQRAEPFVQWLKQNKLRGFIGEYGIPDDDERWLLTMDNFLKYLQANGVNGTYWAAGHRWGDYKLAVQPVNGAERPQMKVLSKYLFVKK